MYELHSNETPLVLFLHVHYSQFFTLLLSLQLEQQYSAPFFSLVILCRWKFRGNRQRLSRFQCIDLWRSKSLHQFEISLKIHGNIKSNWRHQERKLIIHQFLKSFSGSHVTIICPWSFTDPLDNLRVEIHPDTDHRRPDRFIRMFRYQICKQISILGIIRGHI